MSHQHHQKEKQKTTRFFFCSSSAFLRLQNKNLQRWKSDWGCFALADSEFNYLSQWTQPQTHRRGRDTDTGYWGMAWWQCSVISGTWLYNWSLIDMKSSGLAHVVLYTCCQPQAGSACSILVPSSDWCLGVKCPSTISTHNLSMSISVYHLLPFICRFFFCA